jgi:hypothetical protein
LATTDPELIDVFDNFAFDEALQGSTLDVRTRLMVQLAATIASQAIREFRVMLDRSKRSAPATSSGSSLATALAWRIADNRDESHRDSRDARRQSGRLDGTRHRRTVRPMTIVWPRIEGIECERL